MDLTVSQHDEYLLQAPIKKLNGFTSAMSHQAWLQFDTAAVTLDQTMAAAGVIMTDTLPKSIVDLWWVNSPSQFELEEIRLCTMMYKSLPSDKSQADIEMTVMTMGGLLPMANFGIIATSWLMKDSSWRPNCKVTQDADHGGQLYILWSESILSTETYNMFNQRPWGNSLGIAAVRPASAYHLKNEKGSVHSSRYLERIWEFTVMHQFDDEEELKDPDQEGEIITFSSNSSSSSSTGQFGSNHIVHRCMLVDASGCCRQLKTELVCMSVKSHSGVQVRVKHPVS